MYQKPAPIEVNETLTLRSSAEFDDWYLIERKEHDGREWLEPTGPNSMSVRRSARISDADIEGTGDEMRAIARAITARADYSEKRCAAEADGERVYLWSPRNSTRRAVVPFAIADALADEIRAALDKPKAPPLSDPPDEGGDPLDVPVDHQVEDES
jgi:hypothetical protein